MMEFKSFKFDDKDHEKQASKIHASTAPVRSVELEMVKLKFIGMLKSRAENSSKENPMAIFEDITPESIRLMDEEDLQFLAEAGALGGLQLMCETSGAIADTSMLATVAKHMYGDDTPNDGYGIPCTGIPMEELIEKTANCMRDLQTAFVAAVTMAIRRSSPDKISAAVESLKNFHNSTPKTQECVLALAALGMLEINRRNRRNELWFRVSKGETAYNDSFGSGPDKEVDDDEEGQSD